jgi:predicted nucleic acid-binding protein
MAKQPIVVADAGPLIALSRIGALELLQALFSRVAVTEEVRGEILPPGDYPGKSDFHAALDNGWLEIFAPASSDWQPSNPAIDAGERSAIAAALLIGGALLVIDDRAGRAEARACGLPTVGTAAIIGMAKLRGLIPLARPLLDRLASAGYFIGPNVIDAVLADIGE